MNDLQHPYFDVIHFNVIIYIHWDYKITSSEVVFEIKEISQKPS